MRWTNLCSGASARAQPASAFSQRLRTTSARTASVHIQTPGLGGQKQEDLDAHWPVGLANQWVPGSMRNSVSKIKVESCWGRHPVSTSVLHVYLHTHMCARIPTPTNIHIHKIAWTNYFTFWSPEYWNGSHWATVEMLAGQCPFWRP